MSELSKTIESIRKDFTLISGSNIAYLDNAATTQKPQAVLDAVNKYYQEMNANPFRGVYELSEIATESYENARKAVAQFIGAKDASQIVFTRNATESLNLIAYSYGMNFIKEGDEIVGVLHIKDILMKPVDHEHFQVKDYMRDAYFVYVFNHFSDVFASMRMDLVSLSVVLDEYGVMAGIVTLEDIVEEIVGEIDDEYDDNCEEVKKISKNVYLVDGSLNIDEVNDRCGTEFASEEFESIGGLVLGQVNGSPNPHQKVYVDDCMIIIEKIDKNRIELLRLIIPEEESQKENEEKHG